jgi:hypothetical protein
MGNPNNPLSDAIKILDSEPAKNLLSPVTKEVGEFIGTCANLVRFYVTANLESIFTKWARHRNNRALDAEVVKKVMPLFPLASMVGDDELQEKWAALLESTAMADGSLPSFGQTLSQLTVEEVRYLDRLWVIVLGPADFLSVHEPGKRPLAYLTLIKHFDPDINPGVNPAEFEIFKKQFSEAQTANYERLGQAKLVIEDLIRLGILSEYQVAEPDRYLQLSDRKIQVEGSQTILRSQYSFSYYGVSFMQAVTTKHDGSTEDTETDQKKSRTVST